MNFRQAKVALLLLAFHAAAALAQSPPSADSLSDNVGATFGQFEVGQSGAATYSIPIYTPAGRAGVKPELSISYSSQGGYGPLGVGWTISGQSSISRCRQTREHGDFRDATGAPIDGDPAAISYSESDRYCLDGQRLLLVQSACPSPAAGNFRDGDAGAEYRLEHDPWTRVRSWGGDACGQVIVATGNPRHWSVERRDGTVAWYGDSVDSRLDANNVGTARPQAPVAIWALNRTIDSKGNYVDYKYLQNPSQSLGEMLLSQVDWTGYAGSEGAALAPFASIKFVYQTRPRDQWVVGYVSGHQMVGSQELLRIEVSNTDDAGEMVPVRAYLASYETVGFVATTIGSKRRLTEIRECTDSSAGLCYGRAQLVNGQPRVIGTELQYTVHGNTWGAPENSNSAAGAAASLSEKLGQRLGDVTGDGRPDMVWYRNQLINSALKSQIIVAETKVVGGQLTLQTDGSRTPLTMLTRLSKSDGTDTDSWALMDIDGDGKDDLIAPGDPTSPSPTWVAYVTSSATPATAYFGTTPIDLGIPYSAGTTPPTFKLADLDGDGLQDFITRGAVGGQTRLVAHRFKHGGLTSNFPFTASYEILFQFLDDDITDGLTTVKLDSADPNAQVMVSQAVDLVEFTDGRKSIQPVDINGDGRSDLFANVAVTFGVAQRPRSGGVPSRLLKNPGILSPGPTLDHLALHRGHRH